MKLSNPFRVSRSCRRYVLLGCVAWACGSQRDDGAVGSAAGTQALATDDAVECAPVTVPAMTSASAPSGEVTRSGVYSTEYEGWQAFDADVSTMWISETFQTPAWIAYEWAEGTKVVKRYALTFRNGAELSTRAPRDFTFEGWDGSDWVVIDARRNETGWAGSSRREYAVANPGSYAKYRLNVSDDNDDRTGVVVVSLGRIELIGPDCDSNDGRVADEPSIGASAQLQNVGTLAPGASFQDSLLLSVYGVGTTVTVTAPSGATLYCGLGPATCSTTTGTDRLSVWLGANQSQTLNVEAKAPATPGLFTMSFKFSYDNSSGTVTMPVDISGTVRGTAAGTGGSAGHPATGGVSSAGSGNAGGGGCSISARGGEAASGFEGMVVALASLSLRLRRRPRPRSGELNRG